MMRREKSGNVGGDGAQGGLVVVLPMLPTLPMLVMDGTSSKSWAIGMSWTEWAVVH